MNMSNLKLVIKRLISANCQEVFAAWSEPELMQQWLFPMRPGWKAKTSNNFKVGGSYEQIMITEDGIIYTHTGIYKEIKLNEKIVFTWNSDSVTNTLVTIELCAVGNKTEITLIHELLPNEEQRQSHLGGWQECFDHLSVFLAEGNYQCDIIIQAPIEKVYQAITKVEELRKWWTYDCSFDSAKLSDKYTFRFGAIYKTMQVKELVLNEKVIWKCVEHFYPDESLIKNNEWEGTEIIFYLTNNLDNGTLLDFTHVGLTPELECFDICQKGWNYFLNESLKAYLEAGSGKPYC